MIYSRRKIVFTRLMCLAFAVFGLMAPAVAQVHDCTIEAAEDHTGQASVELAWSNPHHRCVKVDTGTTITWTGSFSSHPLAGGVTPNKDGSSPISSSGDDIGSVEFNVIGTFPYFCRIHSGSMTGVIYVVAPKPADFNKSSPDDLAINQPISPDLTWAITDATSYEYCIDTSVDNSCFGGWTSVGANTNANPAGLVLGTVYEWQVRAVNSSGSTEADGGDWWQFTIVPAPPGDFSKTSPANSATAQSTSPTLIWSTSVGVTSYEYCIDTSNNNSCNGNWINTGADTSAAVAGLNMGTDYYWQARARNSGGTTLADGGTWWQFTTVPAPPAIFSKTSPANSATDQSTSPALDWSASAGATSYEYCIDTSNDSSCDGTWTSTGAETSAAVTGLIVDTDYYWQARAGNAGGNTEADLGVWWNFKTSLVGEDLFEDGFETLPP